MTIYNEETSKDKLQDLENWCFKNNGIEWRSLPVRLITLCGAERNLSLVHRWHMSPLLKSKHPSMTGAWTHSPDRVMISKPGNFDWANIEPYP